jgi:hypothetical protein
MADLRVHLDRADAHRRAGELAAAVQAYCDVLDVDPTNVEARVALGPVLSVLRVAGRRSQARPAGLTLLLTMGLAATAFVIGYSLGGRRSAEPKGGPAVTSQNSILAISPYRWNGLWVFDDDRVGLVKEPFVSGIPEIIDAAVKGIADADKGFVLLFSANPFPGATVELEWVREDMSGNWYRWIKTGQEGWLCPALFKYFDKAPPRLYAQAKSKG